MIPEDYCAPSSVHRLHRPNIQAETKNKSKLSSRLVKQTKETYGWYKSNKMRLYFERKQRSMSMQSNLVVRNVLNAFRFSSKYLLCIWFASGARVVNIGKILFSHNISHNLYISFIISTNSRPCSKSTVPRLIMTPSCCILSMTREIFIVALLIFCPDTQCPICLMLFRFPEAEQRKN